MKTKARTSLQAMTEKELNKVLVDAKTALAIGVTNRHTKQSKNVREGRALREKITIVSTLIRQKEMTHE